MKEVSIKLNPFLGGGGMEGVGVGGGGEDYSAKLEKRKKV